MTSYKERVKGETTQPNALLALMHKVGPTRAAKELGVSTTTLYKARNTKKVSRVYEVAAAGLLEENGRAEERDAPLKRDLLRAPPKNATLAESSVFIGEIPRDKAELLKRVVAAIGATLEVEP